MKLWCNNYTYTPIVKWCLEEILKLEEYSLCVNSCVFLENKGGEFIPPDCVYISQDLSHPEDLRALFHEVRHYYQFKNGIYDFNPKDFMPVITPEMTVLEKKLAHYFAYQNYPWELDANEFAMETMRQFHKSPLAKTHQPSKGLR